MEEKRNIFIILSFSISRKVKKATEMQKKQKQKQNCAVCGEGAPTDLMCQKWFL